MLKWTVVNRQQCDSDSSQLFVKEDFPILPEQVAQVTSELFDSDTSGSGTVTADIPNICVTDVADQKAEEDYGNNIVGDDSTTIAYYNKIVGDDNKTFGDDNISVGKTLDTKNKVCDKFGADVPQFRRRNYLVVSA